MHFGQLECINFYGYRRNHQISTYNNIQFINYTCTFRISYSNILFLYIMRQFVHIVTTPSTQVMNYGDTSLFLEEYNIGFQSIQPSLPQKSSDIQQVLNLVQHCVTGDKILSKVPSIFLQNFRIIAFFFTAIGVNFWSLQHSHLSFAFQRYFLKAYLYFNYFQL